MSNENIAMQSGITTSRSKNASTFSINDKSRLVFPKGQDQHDAVNLLVDGDSVHDNSLNIKIHGTYIGGATMQSPPMKGLADPKESQVPTP